MAEREWQALVPPVTAHDITPAAAPIQQSRDISVAPHANAVLAGGNVSIRTYHYHGQRPPGVNFLEVLRLVPNLRKIHLDIFSKATPRTAIWIFGTKYFQLWLIPNGTLKILWGSGIPGAGKSVMASVVINTLNAHAEASKGRVCLAYVYFCYGDAGNLTVRSVLEILVKQTVERHPDCAILAEQTYARHLNEGTQPTQAELHQLLQQFTKGKLVTFYVLDALDEAPEKLLLDIVKVLASLNAKLFITSRPLRSIEAKFLGIHGFTIIAQDHDLDVHISQEISRCEDLEDLLNADPSLKDEVISTIKKSCGGMFLHASLQLNAISRCTTKHDVLETLVEFPSHMEDVYHQTWTRILSQAARNVLLAKVMFIWVINAVQSITIEELRHAIATDRDTYKFERKRLASSATLLSLCYGLLVVEEETKLVRLVHHTAKETLKELLRESLPQPHNLLVAVCITHLTKCAFQDTKIDSAEDFCRTLQHDPLLAYVSRAWSTYAQSTLDHPESRHRTATFVSKCKAFPSFTDPERTGSFDILTPLHILAVYGLPCDLAGDGAAREPNVVTRDFETTPLMLAAWHGNLGMVEALLGLKDIQVNLTDPDGWSALAYAAQEGHEDVVRHLLAHPEIQVNLIDFEGWSALMRAVNRGNKGLVQLLLTRPEIEVNLVNNDGESSLIWAARCGDKGVVQLLLAHPEVQVNMVRHDGRSALICAAHCGHEDTAQLLLNHPDIKVNLVDDEGCSALMRAAYSGQEGMIQLLLIHPEVQVNLVNIEGCSALNLTARQGHTAGAELLLAHPRTQVNLVDNEGCSALMNAAYFGSEGVVQLLLARPEVQVNLVDNEGLSALILAASEGRGAIVKLLLKRPDIQVDLTTLGGETALEVAARCGHNSIVRILSSYYRGLSLSRGHSL